MNNPKNLLLLKLLVDDQAYLLKVTTRKCKNELLAEDILQHVALRLLTNEIAAEITHARNFLLTMVDQTMLNNWRTNKKYVYMSSLTEEGDSGSTLADDIMQREVGCDYQETLENAFMIQSIKRAANNLPKLQRQAINDELNGKLLGEDLDTSEESRSNQPRYNSLKSSRRIVIGKLKDELNPGKEVV